MATWYMIDYGPYDTLYTVIIKESRTLANVPQEFNIKQIQPWALVAHMANS